jgi:hypothetical protein
LKVKFRVHNYPAKDLDRLNYLQKTFLNMPLKTSTTLHKRQQVYSAIDSTHHSVLRLLLLLSQSPTTTTTHISANEEIASLFLEKEENQQQPKYFGNREAFYRAKEAEDNELLRLEWTQEDEEIR